jgi:hypothetical protein
VNKTAMGGSFRTESAESGISTAARPHRWVTLRVRHVEGNGRNALELLQTVFHPCSDGRASVKWINLNLEGAENAHAGQLKPMPTSLGFLSAQAPFGMTTPAPL